MSKKIFTIGITLVAMIVLFQNCSGQSFDAQTPISAGSNNSSSTAIGVPLTTDKPVNLTIDHGSIGNAAGATRVVMKIVGARTSEMRACTALASASSTACTKTSDFILLRTSEQWSYDAATDTYFINQDFTGRGFPNADYISRYLLPSGQQIENRWRPLTFLDNSIGNGTVITRIVMSLTGVGSAGLRGCTGAMSSYATACRNDSDFVLITGQDNWSYSAVGDTYLTNADVTRFGFPFTQYFSRYILPNGLKTEVVFTPRR